MRPISIWINLFSPKTSWCQPLLLCPRTFLQRFLCYSFPCTLRCIVFNVPTYLFSLFTLPNSLAYPTLFETFKLLSYQAISEYPFKRPALNLCTCIVPEPLALRNTPVPLFKTVGLIVSSRSPLSQTPNSSFSS